MITDAGRWLLLLETDMFVNKRNSLLSSQSHSKVHLYIVYYIYHNKIVRIVFSFLIFRFLSVYGESLASAQ